MPDAPKPKKKAGLLLLAILAAVLLAGAIYLLVLGPRAQDAIVAETPVWEETEIPQPELPLPAEVPMPAEPEAPAAASLPAAGPPPVPVKVPAPVAAPDPCRQTSDRLSGFFAHLDGRAYVSLYELPAGSEQHLAELLGKLYANPPVVVRETDSLLTLLRNTSHLYRTVGRSNLFLLKDILEEEAVLIETTMADFYRWSTIAPGCSTPKTAISLPLEGLYDYASFFLGTMGGQSYLFRRPPRIRTLARYYSVLILDRANDQGLNKHGIDIRPAIDSLIGEMEAMQNLQAQDEYLGVLQNLKLKYLARYGR